MAAVPPAGGGAPPAAVPPARAANLPPGAVVGNPPRQQGIPSNNDLISPIRPADRAARLANPNYRPPLTDYIANNPAQVIPASNISYFQAGQDCIQFIDDLMDSEIDPLIMNNGNIQSNLHQYVTSIEKGLVATVILRTMFGFEQRLAPHQTSIWSYLQWSQQNPNATQADRNYWLHFGQPLCDYIFNFVIPPGRVNVNRCYQTNVPRLEANLRRKTGRQEKPVWSNEFMRHAFPLNPSHSAHCDGHFFDYALLIDRVIGRFRDRVQNNGGFLLNHQNIVRAFNGQNNQRLHQIN